MRIYDINRHNSSEIAINRLYFDDVEAQFSGPHCTILLSLTLKANQRTKKQGRIFVPRGGILASVPKIAKWVGIAESKARCVIETLEEELFINRIIYNTSTLFVVRDYDCAIYTAPEEARAETRENIGGYRNLNNPILRGGGGIMTHIEQKELIEKIKCYAHNDVGLCIELGANSIEIRNLYNMISSHLCDASALLYALDEIKKHFGVSE